MNQKRRQELALRQVLRSAAAYGARPNANELAELEDLAVPARVIAEVERLADVAASSFEERRPPLGEAQRGADSMANALVSKIRAADCDDGGDVDVSEMLRRRKLTGGARMTASAKSPPRAPWSERL
jgi:hypothetical protein